MSIIYRLEKGAPITAAELDGNFKELMTRLEKLEARYVPKVISIEKVELVGSELQFRDAAQTLLGKVTLPLPRFVPRGAWQPQQHYAGYDLASHGPRVYVCMSAHQSATQFQETEASWALLIDLTESMSNKNN